MKADKTRKIVKPVSEIKPKGVDLPASKPKGDLEGLKKIKKVDPKKKKKKQAGGGGAVSSDNTNYNAITEAVFGNQ